jgi:hypothetical protein
VRGAKPSANRNTIATTSPLAPLSSAIPAWPLAPLNQIAQGQTLPVDPLGLPVCPLLMGHVGNDAAIHQNALRQSQIRIA